MSKSKYPTIEIVTFTGSEALLKDESVFNPVCEIVLKSQGSQHVYTGRCIDDGEANTRFVCVAWDDREDHQRLMDDPIAYPPLLKSFTQSLVGGFTMYHVPASGDTTHVFTAPVTEITMVEAKDEDEGLELRKLFANWAEASRNAPLAKEHQPFVFGQTAEKADVYYMFGGWATKDQHLNSIDTELKKEIGLLAEKSKSMTVKHCIFKEYKLQDQ